MGVDLDEVTLHRSLDGVDGTLALVAADVSAEGDVERYYRDARSRFGGIDCVFNNAGILGLAATLEDYPTETFERVIATNVSGVFLGMKHAIPLLRERGGGAIVNSASTARSERKA